MLPSVDCTLCLQKWVHFSWL